MNNVLKMKTPTIFLIPYTQSNVSDLRFSLIKHWRHMQLYMVNFSVANINFILHPRNQMSIETLLNIICEIYV
jgi:hypothetical protein